MNSWPLTPEVASTALAGMDFGAGAERIEVVQVDPFNSDPARGLTLALNERFYRSGEQWYDFILRTTYYAGPEHPDYESFHGVWEDALELAEVAFIDPVVSPGGVLRLGLRWRTSIPVEDSFVVFTHVTDEEGTLVAQYDTIPGGGLKPMTGWEPGEIITDRFAITIPAGTPVGEYVVRIGLYRQDNLLRLRVTDGPSAGPDFLVLGRLTVTDGR
jgi:hypothetical protein